MEQLPLFNSFERLTVDDALAIFHEIEGKYKGKNYHYQYKPIKEFFRGRYLDTINKVDVENYRAYRAQEGLLGSTINREHSVITRLLNAFDEWKGIGNIQQYNFSNLRLPIKNPGELVKKVDERQFTRTLVLTPMEFFKFCDYAHPRVRVIVILAVLTLLRKKNLQLLGEENFNAALKQIQTIQSKTKVPITVPAQQTVTAIIENTKYECVCDFTNFVRLFLRARRESGVYFWMTDLRRTSATQMLLDGVDIRTIQRYLGHTTLVMTERYLQPPVQHMIDASRVVEQRFSASLELAGYDVKK